jgi:hypothetical protein
LKKSEDSLKKSEDSLKKSEDSLKCYNCRFCNKEYNNKNSRWSHEKKCKDNQLDNNKINQLDNNNKINELEEKNKKLEETINELKNQVATIIKEKGKIHHKTLQKINKQLNTTNNITNNGVINNVYVKYNNISHDVLTKKEILNILSKHTKALEESIKKIHFNEKIPENNNVFITNLQNNIGYAFDGNQFVAINKGELLNDIIDTHLNEMFLSLNKYKDNIKSQTIDKINYLINMISKENKKYIDYENNSKVYKNYKDYKIDVVKMLIYNNSDKNKFDQIKKLDELFEKIENDELFD